MEKLKATVKRDISLFSVESWEKGYRNSLLDYFGWEYPIIFHYDGVKVHFYHTEQHFSHFKKVITKVLIDDDVLFEKLNQQFKEHIFKLQSLQKDIGDKTIKDLSNLIGSIMSFYIFVVSDAFVTVRPTAWESRKMSEGILYECDERVEEYMKRGLHERGFAKELSHVLCLSEYEALIGSEQKNINAFQSRLNGYIFTGSRVCTDSSLESFCSRSGYELPIRSIQTSALNELSGAVACEGSATGRVKIIRNKKDLSKIEEGDILIACMTNTTYATGMSRAAAIITDEGGITCHAAIAARELGKPCITGMKYATTFFSDGDFVEVNAYKGIVRKVE